MWSFLPRCTTPKPRRVGDRLWRQENLEMKCRPCLRSESGHLLIFETFFPRHLRFVGIISNSVRYIQGEWRNRTPKAHNSGKENFLDRHDRKYHGVLEYL